MSAIESKPMYCFRVLLLFVAITSSYGVDTPQEFRFRIAEDLGNLDWGHGEVNSLIVLQLMDGLTKQDKNGNAIPALATKWQYTNLQKTNLNFYLRKNALWSDGKEICAQDFVDAWTRVKDPAFASPYAHYLQPVKKVQAKSCHILYVELTQPIAYFPELVSHWVYFPIRKELVQKYPSNWDEPPHLVVTGPFILSEWKKDQFYYLKKNQKYYGKAAHLEAIRALVIQDDKTALRTFEENQIDWLKDLPHYDRPQLSKKSEFQSFKTFTGYYLGFSFQSNGLTKNQRCSLLRAIDQEKIPLLLKGAEIPAKGFLPPDLAKENLSALSYSTIPKVKFEKPVSIFYYGKEIHTPVMELIQAQWKEKLGIDVQIKKMEGKTYWGFLQNSPPEIFLSGTTASFSHPYSFIVELTSQSAANWGKFKNIEYDRLALKLAELPSGKEREKLLNRLQNILINEECAVIPLYFRKVGSLLSEKWQGLYINPMAYVYLKDILKK